MKLKVNYVLKVLRSNRSCFIRVLVLEFKTPAMISTIFEGA